MKIIDISTKRAKQQEKVNAVDEVDQALKRSIYIITTTIAATFVIVSLIIVFKII